MNDIISFYLGFLTALILLILLLITWILLMGSHE